MTEITRKAFESETSKILQLMINSIYTNQSIFLRELISNASDACDKIRIKALENHKLLEEFLKITIKLDTKNNTITIMDNGIGMNATDLENNLGVIARSGTQKFLEVFEAKIDKNQLIGQFGVGFYSGFMVADRITVLSTKLDEESKTYVWQSDGDGYYSISQSTETMPRGTCVILNIKNGMEEYLDKHKIRYIATTYSDHIGFPIFLELDNATQEQINKNQAIWTKHSSEVTPEEYKSFYQYLTHSPDEPWMTLHNKVEGNVEYTNLLFIPTKRPFDIFGPDRTTRVKLYIRKVFIADDDLALIPKYLRFLRGIIDTDDLPLNISRETLQHSSKSSKLTKSITKRVLGALKNKAIADQSGYVTFWETFGEVLKEGLCEPILEEKDQLLEICRFRSTKSIASYISLDEYVKNMQDGQDKIYYLIGDSYELMNSNPQLEGFKQRDIEVILLKDTVDAFWITAIDDYKSYNFVSASTENIKFEDNGVKTKNTQQDNDHIHDTAALSEADVQNLMNYIKSILGSRVSKVIISNKLVKSPACLSLPEGVMNTQLESMLIEQKQLKKRFDKILEVNLKHPILQAIHAYLTQKQQELKETESKEIEFEAKTVRKSRSEIFKEENAKQLIEVIFAQACLTAGLRIENPNWVAEIIDNIAIERIKVLNTAD